MAGPARRRACVEHAARRLGAPERSRACAAPGRHRSTQRKAPRTPDDEARLTADILEPAKRPGRCGHRRVAALLRRGGRAVNRKRAARTWRREGLEVPPRRPERGRLWLNDGPCVRLRPERPDHVRARDFVEDRARDGRRFRMLRVVGELTREAPAIRAARELGAAGVVDALSDLFLARGAPAARPRASAPTRGRSSWPRRWRAGSRAWAPPRHPSRRRARGRKDAWRASAASCATSRCGPRCSTRSGKRRR